MTFATGSRLGAYEIVSPLGSGGMGEVYRARDTKLQREVALKVLPDTFAADPDRLARFEREAQLLASLNHPHIGSIYGLEDADRPALVLELVEGPTLADRILQGPVPVDEAIPIARQIAEALEAAHEKGIIHRDLKPANIKLTPDGTVKVLDFGLAKLNDPAVSTIPPPPGLPTLSPTMLSPVPATQAGVILGTAAYMSPEQAKGKTVDRRTDMWAFGCVLFEMLTGRRAFEGDDVTDFLVAVLSREPDWSRLPSHTPPSIHRLLRRCLVKDRRQRLADAASARLDLDDAGMPAATPVVTGGSTRAWLPWGIAAAAVVAAGILWATRPLAPQRPAAAVHFTMQAPAGTVIAGTSGFAVSPDGQRIVFEAVSPGGRRALWLRRLDSPTATMIEGTEAARFAVWSPDGASVAFFAAGKLRRVDVAGGGALALADASGGGATWSPDGVILYGGDVIWRIPASGGGPATAVTTLDEARGEIRHVAPEFLPDGRRFLFLTGTADPGTATVKLATLDGGAPRVLLTGTSNAIYADGHLLYARGGSLMAHRFDLDSAALIGEPVVLAESVRENIQARSVFAAAGGTLVYDAQREFPQAEVAVLSRNGVEIRVFPTSGPFHTLWPSPDFGGAVVESGTAGGGTDLWVLDAARGSRTRLTTGDGVEGHPVWSPDGREIAYFEGVVGVQSRLMVAPAAGTREPRVILDSATYKQTSDWSRDGRLLVFEEQAKETGWDLGVVPADGSGPPRMLLRSRFNERHGALSPDGGLLAYSSTENGPAEIFVVDFPEVTGKWPVSAGGGLKPRWSRDGRELFYVTPSGTIMRVGVTRNGGFGTSAPERLFDVDIIQSDGWDYAVSDDAQRIMVARSSGTEEPSISVITNWPSTLRR